MKSSHLWRRDFKGQRILRGHPIKQRIIWALLLETPKTAWAVAREIDALGSTVSSLMFKMMKQGLLTEVGPATKHGGRRYTVTGAV